MVRWVEGFVVRWGGGTGLDGGGYGVRWGRVRG